LAACGSDDKAPLSSGEADGPGKIAYIAGVSGDWGLHLIDPDVTGQVQLVGGLRSQPSYAWSPDGRQIAYAGNEGIYTMSADGSGQALLIEALGAHSRLVWAPNGEQIAFVVRDAVNRSISDVYVVNVDGTNLTNATKNEGSTIPPGRPTARSSLLPGLPRCI
tara:strand:+ start:142 stop:630 length:489 start_codon:yes stop_codon:yes gene_type:complete